MKYGSTPRTPRIMIPLMMFNEMAMDKLSFTNCIYVGLSQISPLQIRAKDIRYRFSQIKFPNRNTSSLKIKTMESQNHSRAYELIRPARREASSE